MLENLWKQYLNEVIERKFSETQISRTRPTFGVEHEFFLVTQDGSLASGQQSQSVFEYLSLQPGVRIVRDKHSNQISQINFEHAESKSYSVLKYEFFPHLLEFAFGYSTRVDLLEQRIHEIFDLVNRAVVRTNLRISDSAQIPLSELSSESLDALDSKRKTLHEGRQLRLLQSGLDSISANFPAFTAGTQIQVGGIRWWEFEGLIGRLLNSEPELLQKSYLSLFLPKNEALGLMKERFRRYYDVYSAKRLFGFPTFNEWSIENWSNSLSLDLGIAPPRSKEDISTIAAKVHDLSLIAVKPNMATIEFRGCPSLPNCTQIVLELRRRHNQLLEAIETRGNPDLNEARSKFEEIIFNSKNDSRTQVNSSGR